MWTDFAVKHFRGLQSVELHDLSFVNIFVGSNGAGKTSLLEAASIAANPLNPGWLATLSLWRELPAVDPQTDDWLRSFFYGVAPDVPIDISWIDATGNGAVQIAAQMGSRFISAGTLTGSGSSSGPHLDDFIGGVQLRHSPPGGGSRPFRV